MKKHKLLLIVILLIISLVFINTSSIVNTKTTNKPIPIIDKENVEKATSNLPNTTNKTTTNYSILEIDKINLKEKIYSINDKRNNVEENVTLLKDSIMPDKDDSIVFIAAHSGSGKIAYFKDLDKLKENDKIIFIYKDKKYTYYVKDIWEQEKKGYINVGKTKNNQLVLTTCSPNKKDMQLIVNCEEKD